MTPEEIQNSIAQLLQIQRNLQEGQLENRQRLDRLQDSTENLQRSSESMQHSIEGLQRSSESMQRTTQGLIRISENILTAQRGQAESIAQLKRAVDYLISQDGDS